MSLLKKPVFWAGTAVLGIVGFVMTTPEATSKGVTTKPPVRKKASTKLTVFTKEDEEANFAPITVQFKDAFNPIVKREGGGLGSSSGAANAIPTDFADGATGWIYTGSAEIDGAPTALLENRATGDGVFLKASERWKSASVVKITPESVTMSGPSGTKTFTLVADDLPGNRGSVPPATVNVPNNLRGNINPQGMGGFQMPQGGGGVQFAMPPGGDEMFVIPREQ